MTFISDFWPCNFLQSQKSEIKVIRMFRESLGTPMSFFQLCLMTLFCCLRLIMMLFIQMRKITRPLLLVSAPLPALSDLLLCSVDSCQPLHLQVSLCDAAICYENLEMGFHEETASLQKRV